MAARDTATDRVPCHVVLVAGFKGLFVRTRPANWVPYWRVVVDNQVTRYLQVIVMQVEVGKSLKGLPPFLSMFLSNSLVFFVLLLFVLFCFLERKTNRSLFVFFTNRETCFSTAWYSTV